MKVEIYIWSAASKHSHEKWKILSKEIIKQIKVDYIIINHHLKQYRKNFKCSKDQLTTIIVKAKNMKEGQTEYITIYHK